MNTPEQSDGSGPPTPEPRKFARRWAALSPRKKTILGAVLLFTFVLLPLVTIGVHGHVQNNEQFCLGTCHTEAGASLANAPPSHKDMPCASCHDMHFEQNAWLYVLQLTQGASANTPHAVADPALCQNCHASGQGSRLQVSRSVGHQSHASKADLPCSACHGGKTHDLAADKDGCARCHTSTKMYEEGMAKLSCASCHSFLAPSAQAGAAPSTQCRSCHGGKQDPPIVAAVGKTIPGREVSHEMIHGSIFACSVCHQPHESDLEKRRTGRDCGRCHAGAPSSDKKASTNPAHSACGTCHRVHSPRSELTSACATCHAEAKSEKLQHTPAGKHPNCGTCHVAHDFVADRSACATCHSNQSPVANVPRLAAHADCANCHAPHREAAERESCATCHERYRGHGHQHCVTCHDPHKDKSSTKTCASCHAKETSALASAKGGHRGGCQSCHSPHAAGTTAKCANCHAEQSSAVAAAGKTPHGQCASCHRPHTFSASSGGDTCKSCHDISKQGAHKGECRQCHTTHGSPRIGSTACAKCHSDIPRPTRGKHAECRSCHASHQPASGGALGCSQCHAAQQAGARAWKATQHQSCVGCHKPHDPSAVAACTQCHASQASGGSKKHSCRTCHDPHQAPTTWWNRCSSCHSAQSAATKSRGSTHGTCQSCHKPHRLAKPSCTVCHNAMSSLGAHKDRGHANCTSCHDTHAKNAIGRAKCLSCHKDKTAHNPTAKFCTGCHLFK